MSKTKTRVGRILASIFSFFGGVASHTLAGAEKDYNNLTPEEQASLQHGAGVMTFISQEIGKEPDYIRQAILQEFPDLNETSLESGLYTIAKALNLSPEANNLDDTIAKLQAHFNSLSGTVWNDIIQGAAAIFSVVVAPAGAKVSAFADLIRYVYLAFFKK